MADARAARKARIIASQEKRLKFVTGQADTLKPSNDPQQDTLDAMARELEVETKEELAMPSVRVDPAQRRRDAALRRQKQQEKVNERLGVSTAEPSQPAVQTPPPAQEIPKTTVVPNTEIAKSNYSRDVTMYKMEQTGVALVIVVAAVIVGFTMNIEGILANSTILSNPQYATIQAMLAQGIPIESLKMQIERDQVDVNILSHIQQSVARSQGVSVPESTSYLSWFLPSMAHPPLMIFPVAIRLVMGLLFKVARGIVGVPVTADHEGDDSGWIMKMVLAQMPMLRDIFRMAKKLFDDVCIIIVIVCLTIALRVVFATNV
ncbi:hypothetical protein THRCLA_11057 [Thraustotheca clavata]|uniref:Transmembrane protein n=1 Tax=Thraustotheca clavata TaxID=74557 RepID=A0A1V9Y925_9STRA|nr:hypothetical protein THRCLA_11057 [Thraustotheca clavata]